MEGTFQQCPRSCSHAALKCAWSHCRVVAEVPELKPAFLWNSWIWISFHSGSAKPASHPDHFVFYSFNVVRCRHCPQEECNRKSTHAGFCVGNDKLVGALALSEDRRHGGKKWVTDILGFTDHSPQGPKMVETSWNQLKPLRQDWMTCDKEVTPSGTSTARAFAWPGLQSSRSYHNCHNCHNHKISQIQFLESRMVDSSFGLEKHTFFPWRIRC